MLLLTRMTHQRIVIGDNICIEVKAVNGQQVKLAIKAPSEIKIIREELDPQHPALKKYTSS